MGRWLRMKKIASFVTMTFGFAIDGEMAPDEKIASFVTMTFGFAIDGEMAPNEKDCFLRRNDVHFFLLQVSPLPRFHLLPTYHLSFSPLLHLLPTYCYLLPTYCCLLTAAYLLLPTYYCLLTTAYCLLTTAYLLLPTYCYLLTAAYCLPPPKKSLNLHLSLPFAQSLLLQP